MSSLVVDSEPGIKCCWISSAIQRRDKQRSGRESVGFDDFLDVQSGEEKVTQGYGVGRHDKKFLL